MKVFGIYRRLVANQDGVLHELWDDEEWAIARKDALAGNQPQYHWYMCPLQVKSASKRKESRPTVRRVRPCNRPTTPLSFGKGTRLCEQHHVVESVCGCNQ
jgi:hypothetical protein